MGFFKRLIPLKADMQVNLEKMDVEYGEPIKGIARLESKDNFKVECVRLEINVWEIYQAPEIETDSKGNQRQVMKEKSDVLYSRNVEISAPFDMAVGENKDFPFELTSGLPYFQPTHYGGRISYAFKAVANVKGRPDVTKEVHPTVRPSMGVTKIIQKEVIKVTCKYCGTLIDLTAGENKCSNCGATINLA